MARSLQQLQNDIKLARDSAVHLRTEFEKLAQQANGLGAGNNIAELERGLRKAGAAGEETFVRMTKGASNALMQMNRLTQAFSALQIAERNAALSAASTGSGNGIPLKNLMGQQQPATALAKNPLDIYTRGTVTPLSPGIMGQPANVRAALDVAKAGVRDFAREVELAYGNATTVSSNFTVSIDQANGKLVYQTELLRQLGNKVVQKIPVTQTVDPRTMESSRYTQSQQSFIDQAGGLDRANQMLGQHGLTVNNVTGYYKDLNSNVARFSVMAPDGISESMGAMDQFGNATLHAARNAQTLVQNIGRNITKVLEWAAATSVVYAVMNSLMQAAGELDDIDETMADIAISTGAAGAELQKYYESALEVANLTGVDVTDTLEAQSKAYRAASDSTDRFRTANVLLTDSLILARLSGMQQAESLDTLVAALRQSGMSLEQGTELIDKWVKTSQNAGVSIQDLAQSFAITSDVASTVGISIDELNGLISVLAEKTILSSTEIGNALRTMFANITSDEAVKTLGELGIAVEDVNGNMRDWLDINQNIVDLINSGALSDEQVNRLANALGGGSRRGPQLIALWSNFGRVGEIASQSMDANGEAANAMAAKLDTLKSAMNELHNAFNELVQTLGYEGGFLELIVDGIKATTDLVKNINSLAESFEGAASSIAVAVAALIGLKRIAGTINWQTFGGGQIQVPGGAFGQMQQGAGPFSGVANYLNRTPTGGSVQAGVQGLTGGMGIAAAEFTTGVLNHESWNTVGGRVGSTLVGSFVGGMVAGSTGGMIGAFIADAMVRRIQDKQEALRDISSGNLRGKTPEEILQTLTTGLGPGILGGNAFGAQESPLLRPNARSSFDEAEILNLVNKAVQAGVTQNTILGITGGPGVEAIQGKGFNKEEAEAINTFLNNVNPDQLRLAIEGINEYNYALNAQTNALTQASNALPPATALAIGKLIRGEQGGSLQSDFSGQREALIAQAAKTGDSNKLTEMASAMEQVSVATAAVAVAMGDARIETEEYIKLGNVLLNSTDAERERIILLASDINNLKNELQNEPGRGLGKLDPRYGDLFQKQDELRQLTAATEQAASIRKAREDYIGFSRGPEDAQGNLVSANSVDFYSKLDEARKAQAEFAKFQGIDPEALRASVTDPLILAFSDGYHTVEGLTSDFANMFVESMKEMAEEASEALQFSFKAMKDMSPAEFAKVAKRAEYYEKLLPQQFGKFGYDEKAQNIGVLLEGNQAKTINTTMTALQLAIEELTDVEKKQLEGQWNLPSGATAFVPITSLFYQQQNQMGDTQFEPAANTMNTAANTMERAATILAYASSNAAEGAVIASNRARDNAGNRMPYASSNAAEGHVIQLNQNIDVNPQSTTLVLDGRAVANAVSKYSSQSLQQSLRNKGKINTVAV